MLLWWYYGTVRLSEGNTMVYTEMYDYLIQEAFRICLFNGFFLKIMSNGVKLTLFAVFFWANKKGQSAYIS